MGLGAQLGRPMLVMSAMEVVGEAGVVVVVGGGGGGVLDDDLVDVGVLDGAVAVVDLSKVVAPKVELLATAFGAGTLRTSPGCKSLAEIPGFAASRAAMETPCSAAILARVSPLWTLIAFIC